MSDLIDYYWKQKIWNISDCILDNSDVSYQFLIINWYIYLPIHALLLLAILYIEFNWIICYLTGTMELKCFDIIFYK